MNLIIVSLIAIVFFALLLGLFLILFKKIRNRSISPSAGVFFGFVGVILVMALFVLLMGAFKYLQQS